MVLGRLGGREGLVLQQTFEAIREWMHPRCHSRQDQFTSQTLDYSTVLQGDHASNKDLSGDISNQNSNWFLDASPPDGNIGLPGGVPITFHPLLFHFLQITYQMSIFIFMYLLTYVCTLASEGESR